MNSQPIRISLVLIPEAAASTLLGVYDVFRIFPRLVPGAAPYAITLVGETTVPAGTARFAQIPDER